MTIRHIVLSGGAYNGMCILGALEHLNTNKFYDINDIVTIYGTSAGALIGALLCLNIDWQILLNYVIDRPWDKVITFTPDMLFKMITAKGLLDNTFIKAILTKLLVAKNLSEDITLKQLYDLSKIKLAAFAIDVNTFEVVELSYESHPSMKLIDAMYITCSIPFIFQPSYLDNACLIDGGTICNYPVDRCIEYGASSDEILGIQLKAQKGKSSQIQKETNIFNFGYTIFHKLARIARTQPKNSIANCVLIPCESTNIRKALEIIKDREMRESYIKKGRECAQLFLSYKKS